MKERKVKEGEERRELGNKRERGERAEVKGEEMAQKGRRVEGKEEMKEKKLG